MTKTTFGLISLGSVSSKMLLEEAKNLFDEADHIDIRKLEIKIEKGGVNVLYDGGPLKNYDCLMLKGSFKYSSLLFGVSEVFKDKCFMPIQPFAHITAHNKFMTHLVFSTDKKLRMPATYYTAKISETKAFLKTLNYPTIMKFPEGTHGKGVIFTESYASASSMVDALDVFRQPILIQEYINIRSDIRVIVTGKKIAGAMRRIAKGDDIRANAHQGGDAEPFVVTQEIKQMAVTAAERIGASVCAVDIIESDYGPMILEVNTSPGLQKITEVTKKNIAKEIAQYLYDETSKIKTTKDKVVAKDLMGDMGIEEIGSREFEAELVVRNGKIVLPEFVYKMTELEEGKDITIRVNKDKIELVK